VGWEKVACWSTKAAISLKRVMTEEKLLWRAYRKSPTLFRIPTPYDLIFPKIYNTNPKLHKKFKTCIKTHNTERKKETNRTTIKNIRYVE